MAFGKNGSMQQNSVTSWSIWKERGMAADSRKWSRLIKYGARIPADEMGMSGFKGERGTPRLIFRQKGKSHAVQGLSAGPAADNGVRLCCHFN